MPLRALMPRAHGSLAADGTRLELGIGYSSATLSLAALELLVHLNPPVPFKYVAVPVVFDGGLLETITEADQPPGWTEKPPQPATQQIGDRWVAEARSAVLELPNVIIPIETNYLLNLAHSDFRRVRLGKPILFTFDPRLL